MEALNLTPLPAPLPIHHAEVDAAVWRQLPINVQIDGGRFVCLWGSDRRPVTADFAINAAYVTVRGLVWVSLPLPADDPGYRQLADLCPAAGRMQRATYDLTGIYATDEADGRPWLRHGAWPEGWFPLRHENSGDERFELQADRYPFVMVEGDGVHEIPVGPVHAGIIEPGHFRFSVVGERVLRLEERLGYTHKGIGKRFESLPPLDGHRLAGRICGDSTAGYAWAYCMALESAAGCAIPPRAAWLRALLLERERVGNHLGDLGALGNDAAFAFGLAQFSRLREDWLRLNAELFGHRLLMDRIVPGGVAIDLDGDGGARLAAQCDRIEAEVRVLKGIYDEHAGLQDRFLTTGRVSPKLAAQLGLTGLAGRASGQAWDLRADFPAPPYDSLGVNMATHRSGDVAARVTVRFEEVFESLRLIRGICRGLPGGPIRAELQAPAGPARGLGWVEGWRGELLVALELDGRGAIRRCHCHDPSWQNWPLLEHAIIGNIVPDFPLINKSFNLAYSGQDL